MEYNKCIIAPLLRSPGTQETNGSNQTSSENANPGIPVRARSSSVVQTFYIPTIAKYSTTQKVLFGPQGAGGQFPGFAVILLTCQERILNPILGSRYSFMQNTWKVLQARTGTQASLIFRKIPYYARKLCLVLCDLSSPHWSNSFSCMKQHGDMECPNTERAIGGSKRVAAD